MDRSSVTVADSRIGRRARPRPMSPSTDSATSPIDEAVADIQRRSRSLYARGRVAEVLYSLALEIVGESDLSEDDRSWLVEALTAPVAEASQTAIDALINELAVAFRTAPPRVHPPILGARISRIDFE